MESTCKPRHVSRSTAWGHCVDLLDCPRETEVGNFDLNEILRALDFFDHEQVERLQITVQDLWLLDMKEVHTLGDVAGHAEPLLHRELNLFLLMDEVEESAAEAVLREDEDMAVFGVGASAHEIDQVRMSDLDEGGNFPLELFSQVILA